MIEKKEYSEENKKIAIAKLCERIQKETPKALFAVGINEDIETIFGIDINREEWMASLIMSMLRDKDLADNILGVAWAYLTADKVNPELKEKFLREMELDK